MGHWITVAPNSGKSGTTLHLCTGGRREKGNTGIGFRVDSLDKTYKQLGKAGVKFTQPPVDKGWGAFAMFKDPDGNVFWLFPG
jgi:predicted enzyme related to lactoylglutathione lyase